MTNLVDLEALPNGENMTALAEVYLRTEAYRSWVVTASKQLNAYVKEHGAIETIEGTLGLVFEKYEYLPEIADEIPSLGRNHYEFSLPMGVDHSRPLEVLVESMPELETEIRSGWKVVTKVDGRLAAEKARDDSSEAGKRVRELREPKKKLGRASG